MTEAELITVVDYDVCNIGSVANICRKVSAPAEISTDPDTVANAQKLILPGVGHFGRAMDRLASSGLCAALEHAVIARGVPILGICLGMQLLMERSEEGEAAGLGWIGGRVTRFRPEPGSALKVPHMGWDTVEVTREDPLTLDLPQDPRFYFVHSYRAECDREEDVLMWTRYGGPFVSAVRRGNIWGTQFHPEKSHKYGLAIMRNFSQRI